MDHSTKKQHHEQARKKHRHDQVEHARELAKRKPSTLAAWVLGIGLTIMAVVIIIALLF